jgi:hypothetical protein
VEEEGESAVLRDWGLGFMYLDTLYGLGGRPSTRNEGVPGEREGVLGLDTPLREFGLAGGDASDMLPDVALPG